MDGLGIFSIGSSFFAMNLYKKLVEINPNKSIIMSPFSIQMCLSLAHAGAKGKTADEINDALNFDMLDDDITKSIFEEILDKLKNSPILKIANKIYVDKKYELNDNYSKDIIKYYHSEVEKIDFCKSTESANQINSWVENKTNHKIKDLISPDTLDADTTAVLINAIHLKCAWKIAFDTYRTKEEDFWIDENKSIKVNMMNDRDRYFYDNIAQLDASILQLSYKECDLSMLIILPNEKTGLRKLERALKDVCILDLTKNMSLVDINIKIPKFKTEFQTELTEPLKKLDIETMFTDDADFGNLLSSDIPIKISKVIHKAFIEVNEEGTEAAAATGVIARKKRCANINYFEADHPFLYAIIDNNAGLLLFLGSYFAQPESMLDSHNEL